MTGHEEFNDEERPLTPEERRKVRQFLETEERVRWFWATIRVWAFWITSVVAATYAVTEFFSRFVKIKLG